MIFLSAFCLNKDLDQSSEDEPSEPNPSELEADEQSLLRDPIDSANARPPASQPLTKWAKFGKSLHQIAKALRNEEIHRPLIFFLALGFIVPNYDNIHYFFLLNTCGLTVSEYDMLCVVPYIGLIFGTVLYLKFLRRVEVRNLVLASLLFRMLITLA